MDTSEKPNPAAVSLEALEEMVKGPVPVSPAIAATFNAMTPSGAQLTSFFFFLLQLPKKLLPNRTHKKEL
jgi:hypothetical protein